TDPIDRPTPNCYRELASMTVGSKIAELAAEFNRAERDAARAQRRVERLRHEIKRLLSKNSRMTLRRGRGGRPGPSGPAEPALSLVTTSVTGAIVELLHHYPNRDFSVAELKAATDASDKYLRKALVRLKRAKRIESRGWGVYGLAAGHK